MWPLLYRLFVSMIIVSQGVNHFSTFLGLGGEGGGGEGGGSEGMQVGKG